MTPILFLFAGRVELFHGKKWRIWVKTVSVGRKTPAAPKGSRKKSRLAALQSRKRQRLAQAAPFG
jgi:hypothetical protein